MIEKISFGTYRTTYQNPIHVNALNAALDNGVTHIDTSSNYIFGEAEMLIGHCIKNRKREEITIVSKGGYIQGPNMQRINKGWSVEDLVMYDKSCFHSISPMFLEDQIDNSLKRLGSEYIDAYLLHNPEYYLLTEIKAEEIDKHQSIMQERIKKAFAFLETQVKAGKIKSYGISSNSFAKSPEDYHFLAYESLLESAKEVAGENHHFKILQMPMNLYENEGEACASWGHEKGLEIQVNRPLNAFHMGGMLRLASYEPCDEFSELYEEITKIPNEKLQKVIENLMQIQSKFSFQGDVDDMIEYRVIPYIVQSVDLEMKYYELLDKFLDCYKRNIKDAISKIVSRELNIKEPIDEEAIRYLLEKSHVDRVLIGMRDIHYVEKVINYVRK